MGMTYAAVPDADKDGVPDAEDNCPNSDSNVVDQFGCTCPQKNCPSDNNPCTDDCGIINGLPTCGAINNNNPCPGGYCSGGRCQTSVLNSNNTNTSTCFDSDNGLDYYTKGFGFDNIKYFSDAPLYDECFTDFDTDTLSEVYCRDDGYLDTNWYECPSGVCQDGVCKQADVCAAPSISEQNKTTEQPASQSFSMFVNPSTSGNVLSLFFDDRLGIKTEELAKQMKNVLTYDKNTINIKVDEKDANPFILTKTGDKIQQIAFQGYIIELASAPVVAQQKTLTNLAIRNQQKIASMSNLNPAKYAYRTFATQPADVPNLIAQHKAQLKQEKANIKNKINKVLQPQNPITGNAVANPAPVTALGEFENVFNGIALDINSEQAKQIEKISGVKKVYPNLEVKLSLMDSVPLINADELWQLDEDGNKCSTTGKPCLTGTDARIAIIDTGVDYTHPDLGGCFGAECKVIDGFDFINYDNDPMDDHGHGTHVAATAAGNGVLKGVAPDANIYAYKVLDSGGSGSFSSVIAGIDRAVDPNNDGNFSDHVDVLSMSLGGLCWSYDESCGPDDPASQAVDNAVDAGVVAVIAAGNAGPYPGSIATPGTARKAITVGATDKNKVLAYFSSRGPVNTKNDSIIKPDILAPGVAICAAEWDSWLNDRQCLDDKHISISGTSMATPHVAGAAALLLQSHPLWKPEDVKAALMGTAEDLGLDANDQGAGFVDVYKANKPDILIIPASISFGNVIDKIPSPKVIKIKNFKNQPLNLSLSTDCSIAVLNATSIYIAPNEFEDIQLSLSALPEAEGLIRALVLISNGTNNYKVPFSLNSVSEIILFVTNGAAVPYSDIALTNEGLGKIEFKFEVQGPYSFFVPSGKYIAYAAGNADPLNLNSIEYLLASDVSVPVHRRIKVNLDIKNTKPFTIKAKSISGTDLVLYEWTKAYRVYNDQGCYLNYDFADPAYGDRTVFVSNKPNANFDMDVFFKYDGVPSKSKPMDVGRSWSRGFSWLPCIE